MFQCIIICPVGWEIDRVYMLAKELKAHQLYLLHRESYSDPRVRKLKDEHFLDKIKSNLANENIKIKLIKLDGELIFDSVMHKVSQLIVEHHRKNDTIYINMSGSGKREAAATTMAALYHKKKIKGLIYVQPKGYFANSSDSTDPFENHGLSIGMEDFDALPLFQILKPDDHVEQVIAIIHEKGPQKYKQLLEVLSNKNFPGFGSYLDERSELNSSNQYDDQTKKFTNRWNQKLKRRIIDRGTDYFEIMEDGRDKLMSINEEGKKIARLSGLVEDLIGHTGN